MTASTPPAPNPFCITTPIYYVNDRPHIGHCYTTTVADAAARFQRLLGRDVFFLTGTDEHGQKVEKSAALKGVPPQALADENAAQFRAAMDAIGASYDDFIRTTEPRHKRQVQAAFERLVQTGDIELGTFEGWYDEGQEEYVTENQAREKNYTAFNGQPLKRASETNYYFRLDKYQARLEKFYDQHPDFVKPAARFNEVRARFRDGLQKVPVSRTNFSWGIPVPDHLPGGPGHVIYVWIDALLNYATALGKIDPAIAASCGVPAAERAKYWPADVHLIGKEILWFHAVIWPAVLMALGFKDAELPKCVYAHSFFISEGKKMSKTLGNFIDLPTLRAYADRYSLDAVRWYLLTQGPLNETDADFSYAKFVEVYNADLANTFSNSCNRVGNMIEKYFAGAIPAPGAADDSKLLVSDSVTLDPRAVAADALRAAHAHLDRHEFDAALMQGKKLVTLVDQHINATEPFKLAKRIDEPGVRDQIAGILYRCAELLRVASLLLHPALPEKTAQLWRYWNLDILKDRDNPRSGFAAPLADLAAFGGRYAFKPGHAITKGDPLFMRADPKLPAPSAATSPTA